MILPSQYINLSTFAGLGCVGNAYIRQGRESCAGLLIIVILLHVSVYQSLGYIEVVGRAAEESMQAAVVEVKSLPHYSEKCKVGSD